MDHPGSAPLVAAWIGSANAGDELVHAGLRALLAERGVHDVAAVSVAPAATVAGHGGSAVRRGRAVAELAAGRRPGPLVLGGGGILQDETSVANLPYHLAPVVAARLRGAPVVGVGLGAGPLRTRSGRALVRRVLRGVPLTVRDAPTADLLGGAVGLARPPVACDLALHLPDPVGPVDDVVAVALRPWSGGPHRLPVGLRRRSLAPDSARVARLAAAVDAVAARTGLAVRLVAFDTDKDAALHDAVAARLGAEVESVRVPDAAGALAAVASARVVVAMRYHAAVGALLGRRPAVLLGYGPKVDALRDDVGAGFTAAPWDVPDPGAVAAAAAAALAAPADALEGALRRLRRRGDATAAALDETLS